MSDAVTVVSAAGLGTRLGLNKPKSLVEVAGKPVLQWQLEMLRDVEDVIVVAGFQAKAVVELVRDLRPRDAHLPEPRLRLDGDRCQRVQGCSDRPRLGGLP